MLSITNFYLSPHHNLTDTISRVFTVPFSFPFSSTAMDLKTGGLLVPPTVKNSSCSHPRYTSHNFIAHIGIAETIEAVLILILTLGVIGANALVIFVINNRRYSPYIHQQVSVERRQENGVCTMTCFFFKDIGKKKKGSHN